MSTAKELANRTKRSFAVLRMTAVRKFTSLGAPALCHPSIRSGQALSTAMDLASRTKRSFAALRMTGISKLRMTGISELHL